MSTNDFDFDDLLRSDAPFATDTTEIIDTDTANTDNADTDSPTRRRIATVALAALAAVGIAAGLGIWAGSPAMEAEPVKAAATLEPTAPVETPTPTPTPTVEAPAEPAPEPVQEEAPAEEWTEAEAEEWAEPETSESWDTEDYGYADGGYTETYSEPEYVAPAGPSVDASYWFCTSGAQYEVDTCGYAGVVDFAFYRDWGAPLTYGVHWNQGGSAFPSWAGATVEIGGTLYRVEGLAAVLNKSTAKVTDVPTGFDALFQTCLNGDDSTTGFYGLTRI